MSQSITPADDVSEIEPTQPPQAPYNTSIGALSLAFNCVHLAWWAAAAMNGATARTCRPKNARHGIPGSHGPHE